MFVTFLRLGKLMPEPRFSQFYKSENSRCRKKLIKDLLCEDVLLPYKRSLNNEQSPGLSNV